jgi:hypothetical protein
MKRGTIDHPKMKRLARELGIEHLLAVGIMESLWHWTARYAPAGDIGKHSDADIADGIGYRGDMSRLVATLADVGWIDRCERHRFIVHDWPDHADDAVKKWAARNHITLIAKPVTTRVETCPDNGETCPSKICLPLPEPLPSPATATATSEPDKVAVAVVDAAKTLRAEPYGIRYAERAIKAAAERGVSVDEVFAIATFWRVSGEQTKPAPWDRSDLYERIANAMPGEQPDKHWPPHGSWQKRNGRAAQ